MVEREKYEQQYAALVQQYNLSVFPYWSLAAGFLTGKYRSEADFNKSARGAGAAKYLNEKGLAVLGALDRVAAAHDTTPATVALAWLLAQPNIDAPVVSATSNHQLEALFSAPELTLSGEDLDTLDKASK